jgi:surfeit locus 1 family protein
MKRLPILPTLIVAAAVAVLIGLGVWQLERAEWKEGLLAQYAAAAALPALDLDPLLGRAERDFPPLSFRRVLVTCRARNIAPDLRGGRSAGGQSGYSYFVPCRPGADGLAGKLWVNAGWSAMPDNDRKLSLDGLTSGVLGMADRDRDPIILTSAAALPPFQPSAPPSLQDISNNHRLYAFQWFFFAAAAAIIYVLALRRRDLSKLPPGA